MGIGNIDVLVPGFAHVGNIENMPSWKNILKYRVCMYIYIIYIYITHNIYIERSACRLAQCTSKVRDPPHDSKRRLRRRILSW